MWPEYAPQPWKAPLPETEKRTMTEAPAATAAPRRRSVGGGKLHTPLGGGESFDKIQLNLGEELL